MGDPDLLSFLKPSSIVPPIICPVSSAITYALCSRLALQNDLVKKARSAGITEEDDIAAARQFVVESAIAERQAKEAMIVQTMRELEVIYQECEAVEAEAVIDERNLSDTAQRFESITCRRAGLEHWEQLEYERLCGELEARYRQNQEALRAARGLQ